MSKRDWFRKERWREAERTDFFTRLGRAKRDNRAQYLRIQAVHLERAGELEAAVDLLEILLDRYRDQLQVAAAYHQLARCFEMLGRKEGAEAAYRSSLVAMRDVPHSRTNAHLDFAHFVVRERREDLFEEVFTALDEFSEYMILPAEVYKYASAKALILARTRRHTEARIFARRALEEGAREESGLRYHPRLGLVEEIEQEVHEELKILARQP